MPSLSPEEVAALAAEYGIRAIEWHAAHVPPVDLAQARAVRDSMRRHGLKSCSFVPDWRVGDRSFATVLNVAVSLNAKSVRVAVGHLASAETRESERVTLVQTLRDECSLARRAGMTVVVEVRPQTLADSHRARLRLLRQVGHSNLRADWQPSATQGSEDRHDDLIEILPVLGDFRLTSGIDPTEWLGYFRLAAKGRRCAVVGSGVSGEAELRSRIESAKRLLASTSAVCRPLTTLTPQGA